MATLVRTDEIVPQPWADGGGSTRVLLRSGDEAWRVSLVDIDADGPFSVLPGCRRLLTVVQGTALRLVVDGVEHVVEPGRPFALAGDAAVGASVPEGPVRALDVISSVGVDGFVTVLELGRTSVLPLAADQAALVLRGGPSVDSTDVGALDLVAGPAEVAGRCTLAVITLQRTAGPARG